MSEPEAVVHGGEINRLLELAQALAGDNPEKQLALLAYALAVVLRQNGIAADAGARRLAQAVEHMRGVEFEPVMVTLRQ